MMQSFLCISDQFSSFGCLSDVISLSCNDNKTIFVHSAYFGKYFIPCSGGCCQPHPVRDCTELAEDNQIEVNQIINVSISSYDRT